MLHPESDVVDAIHCPSHSTLWAYVLISTYRHVVFNAKCQYNIKEDIFKKRNSTIPLEQGDSHYLRLRWREKCLI
jgi:hypothetical protein